MSVQMRLVHTRMGMTPPALHSGESAREMALHAPQPSPMPARMRACAPASRRPPTAA